MRRFAGDWIQIRTEYLELYGLPLYLNAIARAHLDDLVRRGDLEPVWRPASAAG